MSGRILAALVSVLVLVASAPPADASKCGRLCGPALSQCRTGCGIGGKAARRSCLRACRADVTERCKTQPEPRAACLPPDQWTMLANNMSSTYRNVAERKLSVANVGQLKLDWHFAPRSTVNGAPAIVDGTAYVLTGGSLYALDLTTRTVRWENATIAGTASATYDDGMVFVQTATADVVAVDAATGTVLWRKEIDPLSTGYGSPTVFERFVVVGSAGIPLPAASNYRGGIVAYDRDTGAELWRFYTAEPPNNGVSVWSTPSIDPETRTVFFGTGQNYVGQPGPTSDSLFALALDTGVPVWSTQLTAGDVFSLGGANGPDYDFGTNPILFEATVDGRRRKLVAAGQKSGAVWALDRRTGAIVWSQSVSPGSALIGGMLNNGAFDGTNVIVAGSNGTSTAPGGEPTVPPNRGTARLAALDGATGRIVWERQLGGWVWAPITIANGIGFVGVDTVLEAFDTKTGEKLFTFPTGGTITSAPAITGGKVHFGSGLSYFVGTPARDFWVLSLEGGPGGPGGGGGGTTFSAIYDDIISSGCAGSPCHGAAARGNLMMDTRETAYANLVGVVAAGPACGASNRKRVTVGNPNTSLLYLKISGAPPCGGPMPPAGQLPAADIERIRAWIAGGAPND